MNNSNSLKKDKRKKDLTKEQKEYIVYNYVHLKRGLNSIGKDIGVSGQKIKKTLQEFGVHINNFQEAMSLRRAYEVNDNYFKVQSHNMAYILGFLAADGAVSKNTNHITIDLQVLDEEILYKIKKELQAECPIEHYINNSGHEYARLKICSKTIKEDLFHYGITPQKTYTLSPPIFLEKQYYISYIRGYFDGDGCIYYTTNFEKEQWYVCGARKEVLNWIREVFVNQYKIISPEVKQVKTLKNGDPFYQLTYYGKKINKIFESLYIKDTIYLDRKFKKMKNLYDIKSTRPYSSSVEEKSYAELIQNEV